MNNVHKRYPNYLADQRSFFDQLITEEWDSYISDQWDVARRYEVKKLFDLVQPRYILDVGCGCGFHDAEMANYPFVERVDGIDYSSCSIGKANEAYPHEKVRRWTSDFTDLASEPVYDLIVSFQVFEHLNNPDAYLSKVRSLLSPGGSAAICTPNFDRLDNRIRRWRRLGDSLMDPQHFAEYTPRSLAALASAHGFRPKRHFGYDVTSLMLPALNRLPYKARLAIGYHLPSVCRVFCLVLEPTFDPSS